MLVSLTILEQTADVKPMIPVQQRRLSVQLIQNHGKIFIEHCMSACNRAAASLVEDLRIAERHALNGAQDLPQCSQCCALHACRRLTLLHHSLHKTLIVSISQNVLLYECTAYHEKF